MLFLSVRFASSSREGAICSLGRYGPKELLESIGMRSKQHKHLILIELRHAEAIICLHLDILNKRQTALLRSTRSGIVVAGFLSWSLRCTSLDALVLCSSLGSLPRRLLRLISPICELAASLLAPTLRPLTFGFVLKLGHPLRPHITLTADELV